MQRYKYSCATLINNGEEACGGSVTKDPCRAVKAEQTAKPGKKRGPAPEKKFIGLHGWSCPQHGPTKVKRNINKEVSQ